MKVIKLSLYLNRYTFKNDEERQSLKFNYLDTQSIFHSIYQIQWNFLIEICRKSLYQSKRDKSITF